MKHTITQDKKPPEIGPLRKFRPWTAKAKREFLQWLAWGFSVSAAAEQSGQQREWMYKRRARDPQLAVAWDAAIEQGTDRMEDEAKRRALAGVKDPVFHNGKIVGARLKFSDILLLALLNARRPEKFKYRAEVTSKQEPVDLSRLSDKQLDALEDIRRTLRGERALPDGSANPEQSTPPVEDVVDVIDYYRKPPEGATP